MVELRNFTIADTETLRQFQSLGFESDMYCYKNQKGRDVYLFLKALD